MKISLQDQSQDKNVSVQNNEYSESHELPDRRNNTETNFDTEENISMQRRASKISITEYFKPDSKFSDASKWLEKRKSQISVEYSHLGEAFSDFNFSGFIRTFFYHMLYFCVLGPLTTLIVCIFDSFTFAKNMEFGLRSGAGITQLLLYILILASFVAFSYKPENICLTTVIDLFSTVIFRCVVISLKYGFINKRKITLLRRSFILEEIRRRDQIIPNWSNQYPEDVYKELRESVKRREIDDVLFYFTFFSENFHELRPNLEESSKFMTKHLKEDKIISHSQAQITRGKYHGLSLLFDIIQEANESLRLNKALMFILSLFVSIILFLIPYLIQIDGDFKMRFSQNLTQLNLSDTIGFGTSIIPAVLLSTFNFYILFLLLVNAKRIYITMKHLTAMMTVRKVQIRAHECSNPQLINVFDIMSLKTWSYMRRVVIDYGLNYRKRIEYAAAIITVYNIGVALYFLLVLLFDQTIPNPMVLFLMIMRVVILFFILSFNFIICARINCLYVSQKAACQDLKTTINFISKFKTYYFETKTKNDNYVFFAQKVQSEYAKYLERNPTKTLEEYLEDLEETIRDVMYEIEFDINYSSFKVVGIRAEMNLYKRIILAVVSFILTSIAKFLIYNR